nr:hypothetical protein [Tanacetum cinerariifolium]
MNQHFYEPNMCSNSISSDFDQSQPPQFPVIHQPPQEMSIQEMEDLKQQYLDEMKRLINSEYRDEIKIDELKGNFNNMSIEINKKEKLQQLEQDYTAVITPDFPITNSLIMENEHLDTILETESDEFIKSIVENLVQIPSESEECDILDCDDSQTTNFSTFSNPLFDDSTSSDDESSHEEVIHETSFKTYSNPLFDLDEEIISCEFNLTHNEDLNSNPKNDRVDTKSYLLGSLLNRDTLMASSPKFDSLLEEFFGKFKQWKFRIQQYLQNEHYALWEVIEFGDSYEVLKDSAATGLASDGKKGRTIAITTEDMQKRRNDVKAKTTLLLAFPDEHQLRFSKFKTAQELWAAILKTFGGNEATRKTKKNLLKQQYGNFKAEGKETLEQTFNILQAIVSQLEFMDMEIDQEDLNQKLMTSLALEWLMHTIVWRNRSDLDTMSLYDLYNHLKVYEPEVKKKSNSQNMAFISSSKNNSGNEEDNIAIVPTASSQVSPAGANVAPASISLDTAWKKISIQGTDVAVFDKSKVKCFNCHKMSHFARECRAPRSQDRGKRDNYRQRSKVEEQAPKALMAIDGVGWDWSYMVDDEDNHALVDDEEAPTEFALMAKTSTDNEVFNNSLCSKACKKNTDSLNSQIT